jgi:uncharacterized protein YcnI
MRKNTRTIARLGVGALGLSAVTFFGVGSAAAHVTVTPSTTVAGAYTVLTVSVPHGCEESPTTKVAVQIPESILAVTPTVHPTWDVEKVMVTLDEPVTDAHGNELTERVGEIVYTAKTPLPNGYRDAFELSLKLPDTVGETLVFPAIQTCEEGETAWIEVPEEGAEEPAYPASVFQLTAAESPAAGDTTSAEPVSDAVDSNESAPVAQATAADEGTDALTVVALIVGVLGLLVGGAALVRGRSRA